MKTAKQYVHLIKSILPKCHHLLKSPYKKENLNNPTYGHCYVATELLFHLLKSNKQLADFRSYCGKDDLGVTHWWLANEDMVILDPTADQYLSVERIPPYDVGRKQNFITPNLSKRAKQMMEILRSTYPEL